MKNLALIIFILFLIYGTASPQSCLPEGITFSTQEEIDNFKNNYPGCTEIEGDINISGINITNLNGLNILTAFWGSLWVTGNVTLTSLTGLDNVTFIGEGLMIYYNATLTSLAGLDKVTSIGGDLWINGNDSLISLASLYNVTSIGGDLRIFNNDTLTSLTGLDDVTSIGGYIQIGDNDAMIILSGLNNVTSIGRGLMIYYNPALTSLSGLDSVTSIGGNLYIGSNDALISLTGLDNINAASIYGLSIYNNISLSTCEVQSVCDYLAAPNGTIEIYNNATGCNTQEEVEETCTVSMESKNPEKEISIFPNPANRQLTISKKDGTTIEEVIIYNQTGQIVLLEKPANNIIDISKLQPGLYVIEVKSGHRKVREKLVIEEF